MHSLQHGDFSPRGFGARIERFGAIVTTAPAPGTLALIRGNSTKKPTDRNPWVALLVAR
jgi:hypothetical protein